MSRDGEWPNQSLKLSWTGDNNSNRTGKAIVILFHKVSCIIRIFLDFYNVEIKKDPIRIFLDYYNVEIKKDPSRIFLDFYNVKIKKDPH